MQTCRSACTFTLVLISILAAGSAFAYSNTWTGPTGLFSVVSADTLGSGEFAVSLYFNNFDREYYFMGEDDDGDSADLSYVSLPFAIGFARRFEASLAPAYKFQESDYYSDNDGFGDIMAGLKVALLDEEVAVGLGVLGFVKIPTADEDEGLGTGETDFGAKLLLSKHFGMIGLHLNGGYTVIGEPEDYELDDQMTYGLGVDVAASDTVSLIAELTGETATDDAIEDDSFDLTVGPRITLASGLVVGAGLRYALAMDSDDCPFGGVVQIGFGTGGAAAAKPTPVPNTPPTVVCEVESTEIVLGQFTRIRVRAFDTDGDPITYQWTTTGCRLEAAGPEASLYAENCGPGTYTVTCTVSDGRGGTAACSVNITVAAVRERGTVTLDLPPVPFKQGTRVDNVAKAVLDNIAIQIKKYPDVQVRLVGYTDSDGSEQANERAGRTRAENVKKYLVERHKIPADRFIVESGGESNPVGDNKTAAGRAQNRRVEVIMIVEQTNE